MKNVPSNLNNLKNKVDKLNVEKLVPVPVDLSKLSDVVKNDVAKKDVYNPNIENIEDKIPDITNLAANTTLKAKINEVKKEIPSITNLATTALKAKINEVENKIPNITNFATTALTSVENKIPNVSNLAKRTDYNTKISEIENNITTDHDHDKYITTQEINKLTSENFSARSPQANLASKSDITDFVKKADFDDKLKYVISNKNELNELSKNVKAMSTKGLTKCLINEFSILNGTKYFSSGIFQNYLVFILVKKYTKYFCGTTRIDSWKSNGISEENI